MLYLEKERMKKVINTKKAPKAIGPYNQAILSRNTLYCSGQIAINPNNGKLETENIESEMNRIMKNIIEILDQANMSIKNIVKCTIFMKDMNDYQQINEIYSTYFKTEMPAREAVEVSRLPKDTNIEISVIAVK